MKKPKLVKVPASDAKLTEKGLMVKISENLFLLVPDYTNEPEPKYTVIARRKFAYSSTPIAALDEIRAKNIARMSNDEVLFIFQGEVVPTWNACLAEKPQESDGDKFKEYTVVMRIYTRHYLDHIINFVYGTSPKQIKDNLEKTYANSTTLFIYRGHHKPVWFSQSQKG